MGNLDAAAATIDAARESVLTQLSPATLRDHALRTLFQYPCEERYTAVVLLPESDTMAVRVKNIAAAVSMSAAEAWLDASAAQRALAVTTASVALIGIAAIARLRWHRT